MPVLLNSNRRVQQRMWVVILRRPQDAEGSQHSTSSTMLIRISRPKPAAGSRREQADWFDQESRRNDRLRPEAISGISDSQAEGESGYRSASRGVGSATAERRAGSSCGTHEQRQLAEQRRSCGRRLAFLPYTNIHRVESFNLPLPSPVVP